MNAVASRNVKFVSHSDQGGRGDGVKSRCTAAMPISATAIRTASASGRASEIEARRLPALPARYPSHPSPDPRRPALSTGRACGCRSMLRPTAGITGRSPEGPPVHGRIRIFDIAHPGRHANRLLAAEGGAIASGMSAAATPTSRSTIPSSPTGALAMVDMASRPGQVVGKWWIPGMWAGGGETPSWPRVGATRCTALLVAGNLAEAPEAPLGRLCRRLR
jgi:hypothetical protein